jgi:hypothetical protein
MIKTIGFLSNKLTLRGTEIAMYDYADFNEILLNNKSIIITRNYDLIKGQYDVSLDTYNKFKNRFQVEYYQTQQDIDSIVEKYKLTHLYIIKGGESTDGLISTKCKTLIHCVFNTTQPHGTIYSAISNNVNKLFNTNYPVVPHMIRNHNTTDNMRNELNIPESSIIFGRYGGVETFDIKFVHEAIKNILNVRNDIYFLFMNTNIFYNHPHIIYLNGTCDMYKKRKFINTCDTLIHARSGGETFGLTCGEFAIELKPIITYNGSREKNHIDILGNKSILYNNYQEIYDVLNTFTKKKYDMSNNGYLFYTPENIMKIFNEIYLNS